MDVEIKGEVKPGFEPVRDAFRNLWNDVEIGASFCVFIGGEKVVDIWGGWIDVDMSAEWQSDTLCNVYSTTKGLASAAIAALYDEGGIDFDEKVVAYWPEFGQNGKENVTVAQLLSHQAGLCGVDDKLSVEDLYDQDKMVTLLAAQKPHWEPGTAAGYHAITWGYFPGELVRRITGKTLGRYFAEKVADPLGAGKDCYIGLPESELGRVATMNGPNRARKKPKSPPGKATMPPLYRIALQNPSVSPFRDASSDKWRMAEIAAANAQANGRGIARIYSALANGGEQDGVRIMSPKAIEAATRLEVDNETDLVLGRAMRRSRGFILNTNGAYGPNPNAFGHAGAGGSVGFADPDNHVAVGYAMNQMQADIEASPRSMVLTNVVYRCAGLVLRSAEGGP